LRIRGSKATVKYREAISDSIAITREVPDHILRQPNNRGRILPSTLSRSPKKILDVTDADVWVMAAKTEHFEQTKGVEMTNFLLTDDPVAADSVLTRLLGADLNRISHIERRASSLAIL
jgi:hypothetical protein